MKVAVMRKHIVCLLLSFPVALAAGQAGSEWSGWKGSSDPNVEWRVRTHYWGKIMASDCEVDFRLNGEGTANFRYDINFISDKSAPGQSQHRIGSAYSVARDHNHQGDEMPDCRSVSSVDVTRLARRGGPVIDQKSAHNGTHEVAKPNPVSEPSGSRPSGRDSGTNGGGSSPNTSPDVIEFPGSYRGPTLLNQRLDSRSAGWMLSQSDALGKRLLDWRPMHVWAEHSPYTITQKDWDSLAALVSRSDKGVLRELSAEATRHANEYVNDSALNRFWRAMSAVYQRQLSK
jgi:hypothetical protein